ncbi:DUF6907 domain-containing protein [Streptomyces sp. SYSU K21746]
MSNTVQNRLVPAIGVEHTGRLPHVVAIAHTLSTAFTTALSVAHQHIHDGSRSAASGQPVPTACPDGVAWCIGRPVDHADPSERIHYGPATALTTASGDEVMTFSLVQWDDEDPGLEFEGDGDWDQLTLSQVDTLRADIAEYLARLDAARDQLAGLLDAEQKRTAPASVRAEAAERAAIEAGK